MSSKPSSPGPATPSSTPRRPRKIAKDTAVPERKEGSEGGVILTSEQMENNTTPSAAAPNKDPTTAAPKRRKPRKLNRDPAPPAQDAAAPKEPQAPASTDDLEALKSRVRGLEAKVEELYKANSNGANRSPRRRGKGRKGSSQQQVPTLSTTAEPTEATPEADVEEIGGAEDAEIRRVEGELENARQDLAAYKPRSTPRQRQRGKAKATQEEDDVEEVQRDAPGIETTEDGKQVTLAGSYRIPLPASVSMNDVKSIQTGINSVQNVAKGYLEHRKVQQAAQQATQQVPKSSQSQRKTNTPGPAATGQGQSWGQWFGAYSMQISKAVKTIEAEAAIESKPKGGQGQRAIQGNRTAGTNTGSAKGAAKRPGNQTRLSQQEVNGLVS